jgi:hypothetical protein
MAERPEKFNKTMVTAEKKLLQDMLERGLGVTRRKPAAKRAAVKKPAAKKAAAPRSRVSRKPIADDSPYF